MSELVTKSVARKQLKRKLATRTAVVRLAGFIVIAIVVAVLGVLAAAALYAQGQNNDQVLAEIAERNRVLRLQGI